MSQKLALSLHTVGNFKVVASIFIHSIGKCVEMLSSLWYSSYQILHFQLDLPFKHNNGGATLIWFLLQMFPGLELVFILIFFLCGWRNIFDTHHCVSPIQKNDCGSSMQQLYLYNTILFVCLYLLWTVGWDTASVSLSPVFTVDIPHKSLANWILSPWWKCWLFPKLGALQELVCGLHEVTGCHEETGINKEVQWGWSHSCCAEVSLWMNPQRHEMICGYDRCLLLVWLSSYCSTVFGL